MVSAKRTMQQAWEGTPLMDAGSSWPKGRREPAELSSALPAGATGASTEECRSTRGCATAPPRQPWQGSGKDADQKSSCGGSSLEKLFLLSFQL